MNFKLRDLSLLLLILLGVSSVRAQTDVKIYGAAAFGGEKGGGTVFSYTTEDGFKVLKSFERRAFSDYLPPTYKDNVGYGMATSLDVGAGGEAPCFYSWATDTNLMTVLYKFDEIDGTGILGSILGNNVLYGISSAGSTNRVGALTAYNLVTKEVVSTPMTERPISNPVFYNNKIYFIAISPYQDVLIKSYNPSTSTFATEYALIGLTGSDYQFTELRVSGDHLVSVYGNTNTDYSSGSPVYTGKGQLFYYYPATGTFEIKFDFSTVNREPSGHLTEMNGNWYGSLYEDLSGAQALYEWSPVSGFENLYTLPEYGLLDFQDALTSKNGKLYFIPRDNERYTPVKEYTIATEVIRETATTEDIATFGWKNDSLLVMGYKGITYIRASDLKTEALYNEYSGTLAVPYNGLSLFDAKLYGSVALGGPASGGGVYSMDLTDETISNETEFKKGDGGLQVSKFTRYKDHLIGVNIVGGSFGDLASGRAIDPGTLFEYFPETKEVVVKHKFTEEEGTPFREPVLFNGKLYGYCGGLFGNSTETNLYSYDPETEEFKIEAELDPEKCGFYFQNSPVPYEGKLIFGSQNGLTVGGGIISSWNPVDGSFTMLHDLSDEEGGMTGGFTVKNGKVWGISREGGTDGSGFIFSYDNEIGFVKKFDLLYAVHGGNVITKMVPKGDLLYFTTGDGAENDLGAINTYNVITGEVNVIASMVQSVGSQIAGDLYFVGNDEDGPVTMGTIVTSVEPQSFCPGTPFTVKYEAAGDFKEDNVFTAYLSDSAGVFSKETAIGSRNGVDTIGTITVKMPYGAIAGVHYRIRVKSSSSAITGKANEDDLVINNGPAINAVQGANKPVCAGVQTIFQITETGGSWVSADNAVATIDENGLATTINPGKVEIAYVKNNPDGCISASAKILTVVGYIKDEMTYTGSVDFCEGQSVKLHAPDDYGVYVWQKDGVVISGAKYENLYAKETGLYSVAIKQGKCNRRAEQMVNVRSTPQVPKIKQDMAVLTSDQAAVYQWYKSNEPIQGANSKNYTVTANGVYKVKVASNYGCFNFSKDYNFVNLGIADLAVSGTGVFPNPFKDNVTINALESGSYTLVDVTGRLVLSGELKSGKNLLNTQDLIPGAYVVTINYINSASETVKLTK